MPDTISTSAAVPKRTPLCDEHIQLGARMVDFAGWYMPVQYVGLKEEHHATRKAVGLFDVSHMGEIRFRGPQALPTLEWLTTNEVAKLNTGDAQYSLLPNFSGGLVDDIIIYCLKKNEDYLVCVNASNCEKDFHWMLENNKGAQITNESAQWAQIAVQGPKAFAIVDDIFQAPVSKMNSFTIQNLQFQGFSALVATTGYTGEKGCEIFIDTAGAVPLWRELVQKSKEVGGMPVGLGARDTLRTEMKYSLYGHEIDDQTIPYESGLAWVIKPNSKDFIGKEKMLAAKAAGLKRNLIGFKMQDKGIPRQGYKIYSQDNAEIGAVTSGTVSVTLDEPIGIAYIATQYSPESTEIFIDIRGRKAKAKVCKTPFIQK